MLHTIELMQHECVRRSFAACCKELNVVCSMVSCPMGRRLSSVAKTTKLYQGMLELTKHGDYNN